MKPTFSLSTLSNLLTVIIFILVGVLLVNYFRSVNKVDREQTTSAKTEVTPEMTVPEVVKAGLPAEYTIKKGDSLWKIAQTAYNDGYSWTKVYEANKETIKNANILEVGTQITLPKIEPKVYEHTVVKGDSLWNISVSYCHDGFIWQKIADQNKVTAPNLIEPGLKLSFICQ